MKTLTLDAVLVVVGGVLYGLALPPHDLSIAAWITLVPLLAVAARTSNLGAFAAGFAYGTVFFAVTVAWVLDTVAAYFHTGFLGAIAFSATICLLFVSVYVGLFAVGARMLLREQRWLALIGVPGLWITCELARATFLTGLPWELLGHSQWNVRPLIQIADLGGAYAVSYLVAFVNVSLYLVLRELACAPGRSTPLRATLPMAAALALVAMDLAYGAWRLDIEANRPTRTGALVAIVQGDQEPSWTWDRSKAHRNLVRYSRLTQRALADLSPDLIVWPEYALTLYPDTDPMVRPALERVANHAPGGLVLGAPRIERRRPGLRYFNSVFHVPPNGPISAYDKIRLVPFAEYSPLGVAEASAGEEDRTFGAGTRGNILPSAIGRLGPLICYEIIFPRLTRNLVHAGAELLINLANDGWLDRSGLGASAQHLSMTVFRAVESRRYVVRATTSGISAFVDPTGRVYGRLGTGQAGVTSGRVHPRTDRTPYSTYGDVFAILAGLVSVLALLRTRRHERSA